MKPKDFSVNLQESALLLEALGKNASASECALLARMFERLEAPSVAAIIKKCGTLKQADCAKTENADANLIPIIRSLAKFVLHTGKKAFAQDLDRIADWLTQHRSVSVAEFVKLAETAFLAEPKAEESVKAASPETIRNYLQRLDETYGFEPSFDEVYDQLKADETMKVPQIKKLAKQFTKATVKSRAEALDAIYSKHSNIVEADRHKAARGGRVS